jgi:hypothetical protein
MIRFGVLNDASMVWEYAGTSGSLSEWPDLITITATPSSPRRGCGTRDQQQREAAIACSLTSPSTCAMKPGVWKIFAKATSRMLKPPV